MNGQLGHANPYNHWSWRQDCDIRACQPIICQSGQPTTLTVTGQTGRHPQFGKQPEVTRSNALGRRKIPCLCQKSCIVVKNNLGHQYNETVSCLTFTVPASQANLHHKDKGGPLDYTVY